MGNLLYFVARASCPCALRIVFIVPLLALLLISAKKIDRIQNSLKEAGGVARFERVETVDWIFSVARPSEKGVVTWRGRQRMKRVGSEFAVREDLDTPNGFWTVWVGAITAVQKNGLPVTDPAVLDTLGADTRKRAFWILAPFTFLDADSKGDYLGSAYFQNRLVHRVKFELDKEGGFPLSGPLILQLDPDTSLLRGASWGGEKGGECLLEDFEMRQNLLNIPALWTLYNAAGERMEVLRVNGCVFNSYIEDSLFSVSR
ncbi:MAG: hypothetical protein IPN90_03180 [Elusimicrobia bacterium]|nr:hypothetical protein [Elusimicrobiota bacterium]